jgi:putative molybdopterin biosynthesis protein
LTAKELPSGFWTRPVESIRLNGVMAEIASFGGVWGRQAGWFNGLARLFIQSPTRDTTRKSHMSERFLQISQVADLLEISKTTIRRLVKKGVLPAIRVGRQIRIDERRLEKWLENGGSTLDKKQPH